MNPLIFVFVCRKCTKDPQNPHIGPQHIYFLKFCPRLNQVECILSNSTDSTLANQDFGSFFALKLCQWESFENINFIKNRN